MIVRGNDSNIALLTKFSTNTPSGAVSQLDSESAQAFACLVTGLIFIFIDLGHWERFWHVIAYPQWNSVLTWEIWFYNAYIVILLAELWLLMRSDLARWASEAKSPFRGVYRFLSLGFRRPTTDIQRAACERHTRKWLKFCGVIGIPVALGVHGGTGAIFAVVKARPGWYSPIFPLVFIISALASGGGLLLFLRAFIAPQPQEEKTILPTLAKLTGGFLIFDLLLLGLEFLTGLYGGIPEHVEVYRLITNGPFWYIFWILQILLGAVVALALIYIQPKSASAFRLGIAGFLVFMGVFGVRLNIVIPALAVPVLSGFDAAFDSPRMASLYIPNWIEWTSSLGIVAIMTLLVYAAMRLLPMNEHEPCPYKG